MLNLFGNFITKSILHEIRMLAGKTSLIGLIKFTILYRIQNFDTLVGVGIYESFIDALQAVAFKVDFGAI